MDTVETLGSHGCGATSLSIDVKCEPTVRRARKMKILSYMFHLQKGPRDGVPHIGPLPRYIILSAIRRTICEA